MKIIHSIAFAVFSLAVFAAQAAVPATPEPARNYIVHIAPGGELGLMITVNDSQVSYASLGAKETYVTSECSIATADGSKTSLDHKTYVEGVEITAKGESDGGTYISATVTKLKAMRVVKDGNCRIQIPDLEVVTTTVDVPATIKKAGDTFLSAASPQGYRLVVTRGGDL